MPTGTIRRGLALAAVLLLMPLAAPAAPDGAKLYAANCAACHGKKGRGGVGVPLALPDFLASVTDDYLFKTIRLGRPGRVMPGHPGLSDAQVQAIVEHIRGWMPERMEVALPEGPVEGDPERGKPLYAKHCAECHGDHGEGGHGTGVTFSRPRDLPILAPALNNTGFLKAASDREIKAALVQGRRSTPMDPYPAKGVSEQEIDDIVAYVRAFEDDPITWQPADDDQPVLRYESPYSVEETVAAVKRAALGQNFRLIRVQRLEHGLFPEKGQNPGQVIVYFCNFKFINEALTIDPRVGIFMPCRVTVVKHDDGVHVMAINPKYLSRLYNNQELDEACSQMTEVYRNILEEATF